MILYCIIFYCMTLHYIIYIFYNIHIYLLLLLVYITYIYIYVCLCLLTVMYIFIQQEPRLWGRRPVAQWPGNFADSVALSEGNP